MNNQYSRNSKSVFNFITESPENKTDKLKFGHKEIIAVLKKIVVTQKSNITIGLFGGWGTGKSSIVEALREELIVDSVPLILFDVWKHEGDSLRRTFLKSVVNQLLNNPYGDDYVKDPQILSERINGATSTSREIFKINWPKLKFHSIIIAFLTVLIFTVFFIVHKLLLRINIDVTDTKKYPFYFAVLTYIFSASVIYRYIDSFIKYEKVEIKEEKFQDPHEFEDEFCRLIENLKEDKSKIVIVFDNLDRIAGENALKIISTIKTFLDFNTSKSTKTVFFLIPCDVSSMKSHIGKILSGGDKVDSQYVDEFLRKFFNTNIWIPEFYPNELENFATSKLAETGIPEFKNDHLAWLIIKVFNQNPRQIVQFINLLLSNYLLLQHFCETGSLPPDFYKQNVPQLAKFLLLKQKHPDILENYRITKNYAIDDTSAIRPENEPSFNDLLNITSDIKIVSLEPFFKYRISYFEKNLPGSDRLVELIATDSSDLIPYASSLELKQNSEVFCYVIANHLNKQIIPLAKIKYLNTFFKLTAEFDISIMKSLARDIATFYSSLDSQNYKYIDIGLFHQQFFRQSQHLANAEITKMVSNFLEMITAPDGKLISDIDDQTLFGLCRIFIDKRDYLKADGAELIKTHLDSLYENTELIFQFFESDESQEMFVSDWYKDKVINSFNAVDDKTTEMLELIYLFKPEKRYLGQLIEILNIQWDKLFNSQYLSAEELKRRILILSEVITFDEDKISPDFEGKKDQSFEIIDRASKFIAHDPKLITSRWNLIFLKIMEQSVESLAVQRIIESVFTNNNVELMIYLFDYVEHVNDYFDLNPLLFEGFQLKAIEDLQLLRRIIELENGGIINSILIKLIDRKEIETAILIVIKKHHCLSLVEKEQLLELTYNQVLYQPEPEKYFLLAADITKTIPDSHMLYDLFWQALTEFIINTRDNALRKKLLNVLIHNKEWLSSQNGIQLVDEIVLEIAGQEGSSDAGLINAVIILKSHLSSMSRSQLFNGILQSLIFFPDNVNLISQIELVLTNIEYDFEEIYHFDPDLFTQYIDNLRTFKSLSGHKKILKCIYDLIPITGRGLNSSVVQKVFKLLEKIRLENLRKRTSSGLQFTA